MSHWCPAWEDLFLQMPLHFWTFSTSIQLPSPLDALEYYPMAKSVVRKDKEYQLTNWLIRPTAFSKAKVSDLRKLNHSSLRSSSPFVFAFMRSVSSIPDRITSSARWLVSQLHILGLELLVDYYNS
jgi:hypothetical protein